MNKTISDGSKVRPTVERIDNKIAINWYLNDELLGKNEFKNTYIDEIELRVCFYKKGQEISFLDSPPTVVEKKI